MKKSLFVGLGACLAGLALSAFTLPVTAAETPKKLLLVTVTTGFRHSSIPTAEKVLGKLAKETGAFTIDMVQQPPQEPKAPQKLKNPTAEQEAQYQEQQAKYKAAKTEWDAAVKQVLTKLSPENLKNYDGVIFANTTGDLPLPDPEAFLKWISTGKAFIGMHSATDTFHGFRPYIEMIGGEFRSHGAQATVECKNEDNQAPCCKHLNPNWTVHDEIYLMKNFDPAKTHRLLGLDKEPNSKAPGYYPVAWCKDYGQGKVFYTSLGHREDMWDDETDPSFKRLNSKEVSQAYQKHILGGIKWALGLEPGKAAPQPVQ
jgi:type 1 glutamine amidotransferase